ncbi:MAG: toll/interleukin-1 receptor domain-containing protein, partial [Actinomycetota bacterium]
AVLIEETADSSSPYRAYAGIEVATVADPGRLREFEGLDEIQRHGVALESQGDWLASQLSAPPAAFDVRWLNDPGGQRLRLVALARVDAADRASAASRAEEAVRRLGAVPPHVQAIRIADRAELAAALRPFTPHERGMIEIRKRCLLGRPNRPDAGVRLYLAIRPFTVSGRPWTALLAAMATHPAPLILSVGLMPVAVSSSFIRYLEVNAAGYARLAREGEWRAPGAVYLSSVKLAPEPFAIEAEQLFMNAWRRYCDRVFRIRIQLCSPEPIDDGLANLVGSTISPAKGNPPGPAHTLERPVSVADRQQFVSNLGSLTHRDWGGDPDIWGRMPDQRPPAALRELRFVVDVSEAAAAVRLPIAALHAEAKIFMSYRRSDSSGYANGLYDRLSVYFGPNRVIRDVVSIPAGVDFPRFIAEAVGSCDVLMAVIGKSWLTTKDERGKRRLDDPDDFVRLEIAQALQRNIPVLPVLVESASMPSVENLPHDLGALSMRNALEISDSRWDHDIRRLIAALEELTVKRGKDAGLRL